jgi:hypothetical protein
MVSSRTSFFWNSKVIETDCASDRFGESKCIGLLFWSNSLMFLKQRSFVLLSPSTDEYSQDLMHQKNAIVSRSATVDANVAADDSALAARCISRYTETGRAFCGVGLGSVFFMPFICLCRRGWTVCPSGPW